MRATKNNQGLTIIVITLAFVAMVYAFLLMHSHRSQAEINPQINRPVYQTGEAFEKIDPVPPSAQTSNKTPEELVAEANRIIAETDLLIEQQGLGSTTMSDTEKQTAEQRVARLKEKINELEQQLAQ